MMIFRPILVVAFCLLLVLSAGLVTGEAYDSPAVSPPTSATSVGAFLASQTDVVGSVLVEGTVQGISALGSGITRLDLVDGTATLGVRVKDTEAASLRVGDRIQVRAEPGIVDGVTAGALVAVLQPASYDDIVTQIRSAGIPISSDWQHGGELTIIGADPAASWISGGDPRIVSVLQVVARGGGAGTTTLATASVRRKRFVATLYIYRQGPWLIAYFHRPGPNGIVVRQLGELFGPTAGIPWIVNR